MRIDNFKRLNDEETPIFPKWKTPKPANWNFQGILQSILGLLLWVALIFVFLITLYLYWFGESLKTIINFFKPGNYHIPWWFSVLIFIFVMPLTLAVILVGSLLKIIQK